MANGFDWKRFQFLMEVQTALINNAINLSLEDDAKEMRHKFSASGTLINMDDAFYASEPALPGIPPPTLTPSFSQAALPA